MAKTTVVDTRTGAVALLAAAGAAFTRAPLPALLLAAAAAGWLFC
jgi:hypothetical protein